MAGRAKILFVVEGRKTERQLVSRLVDAFGIRAQVYSVNANIYALYQKVKDDPFAMTVETLFAMRNSESDKELLMQEYTDVFLVFDCDAQHTLDRDEHERLTPRQIANRNLVIIREMAARFDESTDPQKGKLFVNYPMVESFRDCDDFFDEGYAGRTVAISDLPTYKEHVGNRKLVRRHVAEYTRAELESLMRMNVFKLAELAGLGFQPMEYDCFGFEGAQSRIAAHETEMVNAQEAIAVLNTLLYFPLEYFGNRLGLYDRIVNCSFAVT